MTRPAIGLIKGDFSPYHMHSLKGSTCNIGIITFPFGGGGGQLTYSLSRRSAKEISGED